MIGAGFKLALGIFLFFVALYILVLALTGSLSGIVILWAWVSRKPWWAKLIVGLAILQILGWILGILGIGR